MAPSITELLTDEKLAKLGNGLSKFIKGGTLVASIVGVAAWLGLIFITISPVPGGTEAHSTPEPDAESFIVPLDTPGDPSTAATWVTKFISIPGKPTSCIEAATGVLVECVTQGTRFIIRQAPVTGKKYIEWTCVECEDQSIIPGCAPGYYHCGGATERDGAYIDGGLDTLGTEDVLWLVISNIGYLFFTLAIFIGELGIERFAHMFSVLEMWPVKVLLQLFIGVQLINTATQLSITDNHEAFVNFLAMFAGWLLVFVSLVHFSFNLCYIRSFRLFKLCGLCCIVAALVVVLVGGIMGTTDGSGSSD